MKFRAVLLSTLCFSIYILVRIFTHEPPRATDYSNQLQPLRDLDPSQFHHGAVAPPAADRPESTQPTHPIPTDMLDQPELVRLTLDASIKARQLSRAQNLDLNSTASLRVGVKRDGDAKYRYLLDIVEEQPRSNDYETQSFGIRILVDRQSLPYLRGTLIDYKSNDREAGFYFNN